VVSTDSTVVAHRPEALVNESTFKPIKAWAVFGLVCVALEIYVLAAWFVSGDAKSVPAGPTTVPVWMTGFAAFLQIGSVIAGVAFVILVVVRPWRRDGQLSLDGLIGIACLTMFWQDTLINFFSPWFTNSAVFVNLGSWDAHIPGWLSPNGRLNLSPLAMDFPAYIWMFLGGAVVGSAYMRWLKARRPHLGKFALALRCYGVFVAVDLVLELIFLRFGLYSFPGAISWLTVFHGHYYQFPVYEAFFFPLAWTLWACLRHFRDDKGQTFAERGLDEVRTTPRRRTGLRLLALAGACNAILLMYSALVALAGIYASPWPEDVLRRSYLTHGLCGPDTRYACPGPGIPISRPDSAHLTPEGTMEVPKP
jgi:hypothetical protein